MSGLPAPLAGRTALVTGGGSGLGRAITRSLLADGARVVITGRDATTLEETASRLGPVDTMSIGTWASCSIRDR